MVKHKKTGDSGTKNVKKSSEAGGRASGYKLGESSSGGGSNMASDSYRTMSGHGRSSVSSGTGKKSTREPPPCVSIEKCKGEKHYLYDYPRTSKDEAIVMLAEHKKKRDANKKKAILQYLERSGAIADNRDGQTAFLKAKNLGVKVTVLVDTGSEDSAIPSSAMEDTRKRGLPLKVKVLPGRIMLNMARQTELQCDGDAHFVDDDHHTIGTPVHAWSSIDHC
jgi:hypothetical protein